MLARLLRLSSPRTFQSHVASAAQPPRSGFDVRRMHAAPARSVLAIDETRVDPRVSVHAGELVGTCVAFELDVARVDVAGVVARAGGNAAAAVATVLQESTPAQTLLAASSVDMQHLDARIAGLWPSSGYDGATIVQLVEAMARRTTERDVSAESSGAPVPGGFDFVAFDMAPAHQQLARTLFVPSADAYVPPAIASAVLSLECVFAHVVARRLGGVHSKFTVATPDREHARLTMVRSLCSRRSVVLSHAHGRVVRASAEHLVLPDGASTHLRVIDAPSVVDRQNYRSAERVLSAESVNLAATNCALGTALVIQSAIAILDLFSDDTRLGTPEQATQQAFGALVALRCARWFAYATPEFNLAENSFTTPVTEAFELLAHAVPLSALAHIANGHDARGGWRTWTLSRSSTQMVESAFSALRRCMQLVCSTNNGDVAQLYGAIRRAEARLNALAQLVDAGDGAANDGIVADDARLRINSKLEAAELRGEWCAPASLEAMRARLLVAIEAGIAAGKAALAACDSEAAAWHVRDGWRALVDPRASFAVPRGAVPPAVALPPQPPASVAPAAGGGTNARRLTIRLRLGPAPAAPVDSVSPEPTNDDDDEVGLDSADAHDARAGDVDDAIDEAPADERHLAAQVAAALAAAQSSDDAAPVSRDRRKRFAVKKHTRRGADELERASSRRVIVAGARGSIVILPVRDALPEASDQQRTIYYGKHAYVIAVVTGLLKHNADGRNGVRVAAASLLDDCAHGVLRLVRRGVHGLACLEASECAAMPHLSTSGIVRIEREWHGEWRYDSLIGAASAALDAHVGCGFATILEPSVDVLRATHALRLDVAAPPQAPPADASTVAWLTWAAVPAPWWWRGTGWYASTSGIMGAASSALVIAEHAHNGVLRQNGLPAQGAAAAVAMCAAAVRGDVRHVDSIDTRVARKALALVEEAARACTQDSDAARAARILLGK